MVTFEVVRVIELEPIPASGDEGAGESFKFRIEVLRNRNSEGDFMARLYRHETYRIAPTFPTGGVADANEKCDAEILVRDEAFDWESIRGRTSDEVVEAVLAKITHIFSSDS